MKRIVWIKMNMNEWSKFIEDIIEIWNYENKNQIYFEAIKIENDYRVYINEDNDNYWHVPWYCATEIDYKDIPKEYLI